MKRTLSQLHTEIVALKTLAHPNILQLLHVELDAQYPRKNGEQVRKLQLVRKQWVHLGSSRHSFKWLCVGFLNGVWGASFEQMPSIVLALQLAEGGELFDFMMYTGFFNEVVARTLFRQLLSALQVRH